MDHRKKVALKGGKRAREKSSNDSSEPKVKKIALAENLRAISTSVAPPLPPPPPPPPPPQPELFQSLETNHQMTLCLLCGSYMLGNSNGWFSNHVCSTKDVQKYVHCISIIANASNGSIPNASVIADSVAPVQTQPQRKPVVAMGMPPDLRNQLEKAIA